MDFYAPAPSSDGKKLCVVGALQRGELLRYDGTSRRFVPYFSGLSAEGLDFSADGIWITYTLFPEGTLWRSKMDGSERQQLTFAPMRAFLPRWSPNGKEIAFMGAAPGKPWRIFRISAAQNERLRKYGPSKTPRRKTILQVLCVFDRSFLNGKSRWKTERFPVHEVCVAFPARREP